MTDIVVPKLNNNDATYTLVEWLFDDGQTVPPDGVVAVVETSKAAQDLVASQGGVLHRLVDVHTECRFGDVIGHLFATEEDRQRFLRTAGAAQRPAEPDEDDIVVTEPARKLIQQLGIGHEQLLALGRKVIKRADVEDLVRAGARAHTPSGVVHTLPRRQWAVADVVARSHGSIPTAFSVMKIYAGAALQARRKLAGATGRVIGVPELLIKVVAAVRERHPLFFGSFQDDRTVLVPDGAHVGVTIDAGKGLYVPVVRDAHTRSVADIADTLKEFHGKAVHESFREADLAGANIGLSLNTYTDVILTKPIVLPGNTCMLSLCGLEQELVLRKPDGVAVRPYFQLGIAYDHRAVNGRDAMLFLRDIKARFEGRDRLDALLQPVST
jgi:2-oxoglutarate dehydrogenase E2 component (dihydrolipoamide succinyltransferase)